MNGINLKYDNIINFKFSLHDSSKSYSLHPLLLTSLKLIENYFASSNTNKLCLVFPSKENIAQWLSLATAFSSIKHDYISYKNEILDAYKEYKYGEKLILNNNAIVEWIGIKDRKNIEGPTFRTRAEKNAAAVEITIRFSDILKLQRVFKGNQKLSPQNKVMKALPLRTLTPLEKLLNIDTSGNVEYLKDSVCLVSKFHSYEESVEKIKLMDHSINDYFNGVRLNDEGKVNAKSPLVISKNIQDLDLYLTKTDNIKTIIIDGFTKIYDRTINFSDIDKKNLPTILITDLSEIKSFELINEFGFDFFNFTKEFLMANLNEADGIFKHIEKKIIKFTTFKLINELCVDSQLSDVFQYINSIKNDGSNNDLNILKYSLINIFNHLSRISFIPNEEHIANLFSRLGNVELSFNKSRFWLGDTCNAIESSISIIRELIEKFAKIKADKCDKLGKLLDKNKYDFIICPTEDTTTLVERYLEVNSNNFRPKVISASDINNNLSTFNSSRAILIGWPGSDSMNRIINSFLFTDVTLLFYDFENIYFYSMQRCNAKNINKVKPTIDMNGIKMMDKSNNYCSFDYLYNYNESLSSSSNNSFDINELEVNLNSAQFSKYIVKGISEESLKAKRIDFYNGDFIFATETHKFLVINDLFERLDKQYNIYKRKVEELQGGDIISFIRTDRDILVELVDNQFSKSELKNVKYWIDLWKNNLKKQYILFNRNINTLIKGLRNNGCKKDEVTIKSWLFDENKIGPRDIEDLVSIANLTKSKELLDNINTVRAAISTMKGWRHDASDFVINRIKEEIIRKADSIKINSSIQIKGLGSADILKVITFSNVWENIDIRFVNKLINKDLY
ncbi:MAG TPA: DrmE family protein [Ignavibacteria bacterium]|nr:DrmE family protein [Ignavibacteria bacterium]